jgi:hypothetical protein
MVTRPHLKNPKWDKTNLNVMILEKNDVSFNSTNGLPETSASWQSPIPKPYTFVFVTIENDPWYRWNSTAKGVSAKVTCLGKDGKKIEYFARPIDTDAPNSHASYGDIQASKVDIPAGEPIHGFYIAFYLSDEDKFYGFSPQAYHVINYQEDNRIYFDWKDPQLMMYREEVYETTVTFSAENIKKPIEYEFDLSLKKDI